MKTCVRQYMKQEFDKHVLDNLGECYRLGRPNDCIYEVYIAEIAHRIVITGDIMFGANGYGIVSSSGYGLNWFAGPLSERYLCEKFLRNKWQWDVAKEEIQYQIQISKDEGFNGTESWWTERADKLLQFIESPGWKYDTPNEVEFYEFMTDLGDDGCDLAGYDYPRGEAGWICAIQQRFAELYKLL